MPKEKKVVTKYFRLSDGTRHKVSAPTEREAYIKLVERKAELESKKGKPKESYTLEEWGNKCLELKSVSERRMKSYVGLCKNHIFNEIGHLKLEKIKPIDCESCIKQMEGMSQYSINQAKQLLNHFFNKAVDNKLIEENPAKKIVKPKGTITERRALTDEEREAFLAVKDNPRYLVFDIMYSAGLRPSEVRNLKGKDVQIIKGQYILDVHGTKTKNSVRKVPIPESLYERIKDTPEDDYICKTIRKVYMDEKGYERAYLSLKKAMNIQMGCESYKGEPIPPYKLDDDFVPYYFRHDYCTRLCLRGLAPAVIMKIMGHKDTTMINKIYAHIQDMNLIDIFKENEW